MSAKRKHSARAAETQRDELVPDGVVAAELGTTRMGLWRRSHDPVAIAEGFPPPISVNKRNFRSRLQLERYKANLMRRAMREHAARLELRRREPVSV